MINSNTSLFGLFGNPVAHSLSPVMHNRAFEETGYNGLYLAFNIVDLSTAVKGIRALNMKGISVTVPYKVAVMEFLDVHDDLAVKVGAVNTISNQNGKLIGYNTDCHGAIKALTEKTTVKDKNVAVIGAGGAARAIGTGIVLAGGKLTIYNRSTINGERLASDLDSEFRPLSEFGRSGCQVLINTTPVGMTPNKEAMPVKSTALNKEMVVMDIVYNPLKTMLLKVAEERGAEIIDGVGMFVNQGALQFELWTDQKAPIDIMRSTVLDALKS